MSHDLCVTKTQAAQLRGVRWRTVHRWCQNWPQLMDGHGKIDLAKLDAAVLELHRLEHRGAPLGKQWLRSRKRKVRPEAKKFHRQVRALHEKARPARGRERLRKDSDAGVATIQGLKMQFRLYRRQIGDTWKKWKPADVDFALGELGEITQFIADLQSRTGKHC